MIHDYVATLGVNNTPIYMYLCSNLVWGGLLDTGSRPSVEENWYKFPPYNRSFTEPSPIIFEDFLLQLSGKVPPPSANQNTNPNAGAAGQKRPAPTTNSSDQPPVKTTTSQVQR